MNENYLQKARERDAIYKTKRDKQNLEKAVSYRVKRDLELLEKIKQDLSIIYTLDEYKICKHISRLRNLIYKSNLSNDEKFEMLKFVNSAIPKVALKRIEERRERARKNGYSF